MNGAKMKRSHFWFGQSAPGCKSFMKTMLAEEFSFRNRMIVYSGCNTDGDLKYFNNKKIGFAKF